MSPQDGFSCRWSTPALRCPPARLLKVYAIRNWSHSVRADREGIGQYLWAEWHWGGIYLMVPQPKPQATNNEDGLVAFDWPASVWLEMKCPALSYRGRTSFVRPGSGNIFPACHSGCSSLSWMMLLKLQLLQWEDFTCTSRGACNGLACLEEIIRHPRASLNTAAIPCSDE